ncbi:MAG: phosphatase PAP2 family protein [Gammaproteobacteria bacterium]|nr:phosphatase PAP2 family protein [Gammaproteobacteria bacterium]
MQFVRVPIIWFIPCFLIVIFASMIRATPAYAGDDIERAGDVIQILVPAAALGVTYLKEDEEGRWQFLKAGATTSISVHSLKYIVDKWRPNHSDTKSFPSGHTAAAFSGASFLQTRYGASYGIPAYALASFVGYSRIHAEKHFSDDVLAGASIAMLSNWFFTTPLDNGATLAPEIMDEGFGLSVNYAIDNPAKNTEVRIGKPKYHFSFSFGSSAIGRNDVWSPESTGSRLRLDEFDKHANPTFSSRVRFDYFIDDRQGLVFEINPLEMRDEGTFPDDVRFQGEIYPADTETFMEYNINEILAAYRYRLIKTGAFELKAGGGLARQSTWIRIVSGNIDEKVSETDFVPYFSAQFDYSISPLITVQLQVDGVSLSSNKLFDTELSARYQLSSQWDIGLGLRYYEREQESEQIRNVFREQDYFMTIGYSF